MARRVGGALAALGREQAADIDRVRIETDRRLNVELECQADDVRARGQLTETSALVASADAVAYGARVATANGSIGLDSPFPFRFQGRVNGIDLRRVPTTVPVPMA